jgi:hypothetical protein
VKRGTRLIGVAAGASARGDEDFDGVDVTARALRVACRIAWLGSREGPVTSAQPPRGLPLPVGARNSALSSSQRPVGRFGRIRVL